MQTLMSSKRAELSAKKIGRRLPASRESSGAQKVCNVQSCDENVENLIRLP